MILRAESVQSDRLPLATGESRPQGHARQVRRIAVPHRPEAQRHPGLSIRLRRVHPLVEDSGSCTVLHPNSAFTSRGLYHRRPCATRVHQGWGQGESCAIPCRMRGTWYWRNDSRSVRDRSLDANPTLGFRAYFCSSDSGAAHFARGCSRASYAHQAWEGGELSRRWVARPQDVRDVGARVTR